VVGSYGNSCYRINLDDLMVGVNENKISINNKLGMQVSPNPMSNHALISFKLSHAGYTRATIYAPDGRLIETIFKGNLPKGQNEIRIDINNGQLANCKTGAYICKIQSGEYAQTKKILIVR